MVLAAAQRVTIGVDVGGTKLSAAVVDAEGRASLFQRWPERRRDYEDVLGAIVQMVTRLRAAVADDGRSVVAVGVATAAFLDADRRRVRQATYLRWRDRAFRADLRERLRLPVVIENDADAAAWGEYLHGAGQRERCLVLATVGTGIGGGIVIDGHLLSGGFGLASEFGHPRIDPDGRQCDCGARGCLEQYTSGTALPRAVRAAAVADPVAAAALLARAQGDPERIDGPLVTAVASQGDEVARRALADAGEWLGRGLAQVATIVDPSLVLIGGGLGAAGELLIEPARTAYRAALSIRHVRPVAPIRAAALGNTAGLIGATALARAAAGPSDRSADMRARSEAAVD